MKFSFLLRSFIAMCFLTLFPVHLYSQNVNTNKKLKLTAIKQVKIPPGRGKYELSGMTYDSKVGIITIDDSSHYLCRIDTSEVGTWKLFETVKVTSTDSTDSQKKSNFEAVTIANGHTYISAEERKYSIYERIDSKLKPVNVNQNRIKSLVGTDNAGIEAIAYDSISQTLYFADEASQATPSYKKPVIYSTPLVDENSPINIFHSFQGSDDISDMVIYGEYLYVLKRLKCEIEKWRLADKSFVERRSFKRLLFKENKQELFECVNSNYGLAEALMIRDGKIFVGLDNQGEKICPEFLKENKQKIQDEISVADQLLDSTVFKRTNHPLIFIFEDDTFIK